MKAERLVFPGKGQCEVESFDVPDAPDKGFVLIKNRTAFVSAGTELSMYCGIHRGLEVPEFKYAKYPFRPGYSAVGEVVAVGDEVEGIKAGDRVLHQGSHATYAMMPAARLFVGGALPEGISDAQAVFLPMAAISLTSIRAFAPCPGDNVAVVGLGVVGNLAGQIYRNCGAAVVAGYDRATGRVAAALKCGLDYGWDANKKPLKEWATEVTDGLQIVVEAVGLNPTIEASVEGVAEGGTVILLGSPRDKIEMDPYFQIHRRRVCVRGAYANWKPNDKPMLVHWMETGRIVVDPLISGEIPYTDGKKAYDQLVEDPDNNIGLLLKFPE